MSHSYKKKSNWADHYTKKAKTEQYPARSVYKLKEIQSKYNIIKRNDRILDLGCSPGSWLIYASKIIGNNGTVVGIDLKPAKIVMPKNSMVLTGNIINFNIILNNQIKLGFNSIISDMSPNTTGNSIVDTTRSFQLCKTALEIADISLIRGGNFLCKIFHGESLKDFSEAVKKKFRKQILFKPKSTRKTSKEIYVLGLNKF